MKRIELYIWIVSAVLVLYGLSIGPLACFAIKHTKKGSFADRAVTAYCWPVARACESSTVVHTIVWQYFMLWWGVFDIDETDIFMRAFETEGPT